jgi:STE24 endopeptidase
MSLDAAQCCRYVAAGLITAHALADFALEQINRRHAMRHAAAAPGDAQGLISPAAYRTSIAYTLAKSRVNQGAGLCATVMLLLALYSGLLPWFYAEIAARWGTSVWVMAGFLFAVGLALALTGLPWDWYVQFHLEARFGFNTTTSSLWWTDRGKGLLLSALLGYPLLVLLLWLGDRVGSAWWLWAWAAVVVFELVLAFLAPAVILPWFNKLTPLPAGALRDRLVSLARRTGFRAHSIQIMDGSKRSRHSNAFFAGFGRFRKIVLFDTLIQQLTESELEAVLAHEIGHYRRRHVAKMMAVSTLGLLAGFWLLAWLAQQSWFHQAFGFAAGQLAVSFLLFGLLAGTASFWLSPLFNRWLRRHEYQADAFAAATMGEPESLSAALRKLSESNLSNLAPHPLYSGFHYSHPTVSERIRALQRGAAPGRSS